MSSSSTAQAIVWISEQYTIYVSFFILIGGLIGNILNILAFTTLRLFRGNQCAFYLTVESIVNIGQLLIPFTTRILTDAFAIDWTLSSLAWCKIRAVLTQAITLLSIYIVCCASFDQYLATNHRPSWRQMSTLKLAQRLTIAIICFVTLHGIPFFIFNEIRPSKGCTIYNATFNQYYSFFFYLILLGLLPAFVSSSFGLFAFRNVRRIVRRQIPVVRRRLDRQFTAMILVRIVCLVVLILPYVICRMYQVNTTIGPNQLILSAVIQLIYAILISIFYVNFAGSFYIFLASSPRYRRQIRHMLGKKLWRSWKRWCGLRWMCGIENRIDPKQDPSPESAVEVEE